MFLHGWGASIPAFLFVANEMAKSHRVLLLDFPAFGQSEEPSVPYGVNDYADDVKKLLCLLNVKSADFVCHSFGGRVAIEIASSDESQLVRRLVLVDSAGLKPHRGLKYHFKVITHKLLKRLGGNGLKGSADFQALSPMMKETFKKVVNYHQNSKIENIVCPTIIFWGKKDRETPPYMAHTLNHKIADSAIIWLDGGHFAYAEDAAKFIAVLREFLK